MAEKVTREELREMKIGESRTFVLPNAQACDSAKSSAYQMQNHLKCKFVASTDYKNNSLTLTKTK